jgi:hypothetical protein
MHPVIAVGIDQSDIGELPHIEASEGAAALRGREARGVDPGEEVVRHPQQGGFQG